MAEKIQSIVIVIVTLTLILVAVALGVSWVAGHNSSISVSEIASDAPQLEKIELDDPEYGEGDIIAVPDERVPKSFPERLVSAPIALLPNRVGYPEYDQRIELPSKEASAIIKLLKDFLPKWETFTPGQERAYENKLRRYVVEGGINTIANRTDSTDTAGVCLAPECPLGSQWAAGGYDLAKSTFFIDYDTERVYVVSYSIIKQVGSRNLSSQANRIVNRSYGIILKKQANTWLVERLAAETILPNADTSPKQEFEG